MERYERAAKFWDPKLVDCNSHTLQNHPGPGDEYEDTEELRELFSKVAFDENGRPVPRNGEESTDILSDNWNKGSDDRGNDHEHPPRPHTPVHAHGYGYGCGGGSGGGPNKASIGISYVDDSIIRLYQCNFCGNSSAALKKCGRCGQARYCDASWWVYLSYSRSALTIVPAADIDIPAKKTIGKSIRKHVANER